MKTGTAVYSAVPVLAKYDIKIWKSDLIMEFNEKLQELRKAKGLTQEELAECIYVSRTAISKWESGRGYPNIDSLKAISNFFGVTIDALLSGEELLTIAEEDNRQKEGQVRDIVFGLLDCSAAMLFFLPFFGQREQEIIQPVSLLSLSQAAPYLRISYYAIVIGIMLSGICMLALQNCRNLVLKRSLTIMSFALNTMGTFLFVISSQPYAATLLLVFLVIKAQMQMKWQ